jgi:hypothetical protein
MIYCSYCIDPENDGTNIGNYVCIVPGCNNLVESHEHICENCDAKIRQGDCCSCGEPNPDAEDQALCKRCCNLFGFHHNCPTCGMNRVMRRTDKECILCTTEKETTW